jgi:hypothetical protein
VPVNLDTKPYRDEHDLDLLRRMMAAIEKGRMPPARAKVAVSKAVQKVIHNVEARRCKKLPAVARRRRKRAAAK